MDRKITNRYWYRIFAMISLPIINYTVYLHAKHPPISLKVHFIAEISSTANKNKLKATIDEQTKKRISAKNKMFEVKAHNAWLAKRQ